MMEIQENSSLLFTEFRLLVEVWHFQIQIFRKKMLIKPQRNFVSCGIQLEMIVQFRTDVTSIEFQELGKWNSLICVWLFATLLTVAGQALLCMGFLRQVYCSGLPFPSPGGLPDSGIEPRSPAFPDSGIEPRSPALQEGS